MHLKNLLKNALKNSFKNSKNSNLPNSNSWPNFEFENENRIRYFTVNSIVISKFEFDIYG
jgi:hypothetical protein